MEWIVTALRESHQDEKAFHDGAIGRLQAEYRRLQDRIDAMYVDKLDGRVDNAFFDRKSAEWRAEQDRILRDIETHQGANRTYIEEGVQLLRLADRAHALFERQEPAEKRRLLNFLLSNCVWKDGVLTAEYRQPFDILALVRHAAGDAVEEVGAKNGRFENWLPSTNGARTFSAVLRGPGEPSMAQSAIRTITLWEAVSRKFLRTIDRKGGMAGTANTLFAVGA